MEVTHSHQNDNQGEYLIMCGDKIEDWDQNLEPLQCTDYGITDRKKGVDIYLAYVEYPINSIPGEATVSAKMKFKVLGFSSALYKRVYSPDVQLQEEFHMATPPIGAGNKWATC